MKKTGGAHPHGNLRGGPKTVFSAHKPLWAVAQKNSKGDRVK